jgi:hypothetical protein
MSDLFYDFVEESKNTALNCMNDDNIPILTQLSKIPEDIIESIRNLGPVALNVDFVIPGSGGGNSTYVVVG